MSVRITSLPSGLAVVTETAPHVKTAAIGVFIGAGSDHGFGPVPKPDLVDFVTASGLVVHVPRVGDQTWNAPLPSAPYERPGLRLRRAGELGSGFVLDSDQTIKRPRE